MFLELDVWVYSSFDRSGTTGFKYSSLRASLLTVLRVELLGLVQASRHYFSFHKQSEVSLGKYGGII